MRVAIQALGVLTLGLVLTAVVLEGWARLQPRRFFLTWDPTLGFKLDPGARGAYRGRWMLQANPHIDTPIRINDLGMRGPDRASTAVPGVRRLAILGDSFVQAFEVPWEETFYADLEVRARTAAGVSLETLPMGVNGYGQAQQLLWLEQVIDRLEPDVVLLVLFLGNDITDNARGLGAGAARPYFELRDGELVQVARPGKAARWKYRMAGHLRTFLLYREVVAHVDALREVARRLGWVNYPEYDASADADRQAKIRRAWDLTFALVGRIREVAERSGARFRLAFHGRYPTGSQEAPGERVLRFCTESGTECVDLAAVLDGNPENFVPEDGHWTASGHRVVANRIWSRWSDDLLGRRESARPHADGGAAR